MFVRENKRAKKASANGIYTIGTVQFKIRKGDVIPDAAENVIYRDADAVTTTDDLVSDRIAEDTSDEDDTETTTDDAPVETTTKRRASKKS